MWPQAVVQIATLKLKKELVEPQRFLEIVANLIQNSLVRPTQALGEGQQSFGAPLGSASRHGFFR